MPNFRVHIDREECVMDGVCWMLCPDVFEANSEDGKSQIREEHRVKDRIEEGLVPEDLRECINEAATACPVQIIHIEES
ncbi:MAG: ferredoxin [Thermoproteota archaeon]|nr:MAG: ferredoxin [Candidatus Korarchaeota archaeon]